MFLGVCGIYSNFNEMFSFSCFSKGISKLKLFQNAEDCRKFLETLTCVCELMNFNLLNYGVLGTHAHYILGRLNSTQSTILPDGLAFEVKTAVRLVNRRYGEYFRSKYHFVGEVFVKNHETIILVNHSNDFNAKVQYNHLNTCFAHMYNTLEDDAFTSYIYFLACFVHNPEIQGLPVVCRITSQPEFLFLFRSTRFEFVIKQFSLRVGHSFLAGVREFVCTHNTKLHEKIPIAEFQQKELGIFALLQNPQSLIIAKTRGHKLLRYIDFLSSSKDLITRENHLQFFETFSAFFPWSAKPLHESFEMIRKHYPCEFAEFVAALQGKVSENRIHLLTGAHRKFIRKLRK